MDNGAVFGDTINRYLRSIGYSQKHLADALGLHPKVLSRKLCGSSNARLTQLEVKRIITRLVLWNVVTSQEEVVYLLELAHLKRSSFSAQEWQTPPFSELKLESVQDKPSHIFDPQCRQHNLPAPATRLVGRARAVESLQMLLEREGVRLITLTGPGGCGKSRLALEVANALYGTFAHGAWLVELDDICDPTLLPLSIMRVLDISAVPGVPPMKSLIEYLRDKQLLFLLDNFEHIMDAAPLVGELLAGAPGLKILVTSRAVLHLYGEHEYNVPPLDVPDLALIPQDATALAQKAAVQLFVERAQAVLYDFCLTPENAFVIAQICARLDGLPLALELAAAWVKLLPPDLLLQGLGTSRYSLLTGGARNLPERQQTLRSTVAWSYNLLDVSEQLLFRRMSVFPASWTLEAAKAICFDGDARGREDGHALSDLASLQNKSLLMIVSRAGVGLRFVMLDTIREYGLEQLQELGEAEVVQRSHALYYLAYVEKAEQACYGKPQLAPLEQEQENIRVALQWFIGHLTESLSFPGGLERVAVFAHQCLKLFQQSNHARGITLALSLLDSVVPAQGGSTLLREGMFS